MIGETPSGDSGSPSFSIPCTDWLHSRLLRCGPTPATPVDDYQSDGDRGPHQRVQPAHPVFSCSSGPELTRVDTPFGRMGHEGHEDAAPAAIEQPGVEEGHPSRGQKIDGAEINSGRSTSGRCQTATSTARRAVASAAADPPASEVARTRASRAPHPSGRPGD